MKNSKVLLQEILSAITLREKRDEIQAIAFILLENVFRISRVDVMAGKLIPVTEESAKSLQRSIERINQHEPVQYVVGEEYFFGRKFQVNSSVLIPRPETEELIRTVLRWSAHPGVSTRVLRVLDIGTGSGCIPITLFLECGSPEVYATDISNAALSVAVNNAELLEAKVTFIEHDILIDNLPLGDLDVVVSNPPYVTEREKKLMKRNVLDFEPHTALFVPDKDPLLFYKEITVKAMEGLRPGGLLAVEINENFAEEVSRLFHDAGFRDVLIANDIGEKPRLVRGLKPGPTS